MVLPAVPVQAAKQAELAALDLVRLSKPGGRPGQGAGSEGSGLAWSFLSHLGTMLLNKLQMSVRNVHVCFQVYRVFCLIDHMSSAFCPASDRCAAGHLWQACLWKSQCCPWLT